MQTEMERRPAIRVENLQMLSKLVEILQVLRKPVFLYFEVLYVWAV